MTQAEPVLHELYADDKTAWLEAMAELIEARAYKALDYDNLREYLTDMAARDRREVESRLVVLLHHVLKWEGQPEKRSGSWKASILVQALELSQTAQRGAPEPCRGRPREGLSPCRRDRVGGNRPSRRFLPDRLRVHPRRVDRLQTCLIFIRRPNVPKLTVDGVGEFEVPDQKRLVLALTDEAKVDQLHACGGNARCTTCKVEFVSGEPDADDAAAEKAVLAAKGLTGVRLSCQIVCDHDMEVKVVSRLAGSGRADAGKRPSEIVRPPPVWEAK